MDRSHSSQSPNDHVPSQLDLSNATYEAFQNSISSLPMPRTSDEDDEDDEDEVLGLVMDRSAASSVISMEPNERLEILQKANHELSKKLIENERTLQNKLNDHELELEEMEQKLEETRAELTAAKREEKELRGKEVCMTSRL
jgi:predicted RNase H-like nuclease (RuvC/YqgF family)